MIPLMNALIFIVENVLTLYMYVIVAAIVLSWLVGFNIVNPYNPAVKTIQSFCYRATEPLLAPIRRFMPDLGGLDISPIVLLIGVGACRIFVVGLLESFVTS